MNEQLETLAEIAYNTYFDSLEVEHLPFSELPEKFQKSWFAIAETLQHKLQEEQTENSWKLDGFVWLEPENSYFGYRDNWYDPSFRSFGFGLFAIGWHV